MGREGRKDRKGRESGGGCHFFIHFEPCFWYWLTG